MEKFAPSTVTFGVDMKVEDLEKDIAERISKIAKEKADINEANSGTPEYRNLKKQFKKQAQQASELIGLLDPQTFNAQWFKVDLAVAHIGVGEGQNVLSGFIEQQSPHVEQLIEEAVAKWDHTVFKFIKANFLLERERLEEAENAIKTLNQEQASTKKLWIDLFDKRGDIEGVKGLLDKYNQEFDKFISDKRPESFDILFDYHMGPVWARGFDFVRAERNIDEVKKWLDEQFKLHPRSVWVKHEIARFLIDNNYLDQAEELLKQWIQACMKPDNKDLVYEEEMRWRVMLAEARKAKGDLDGAIRSLRKARKVVNKEFYTKEIELIKSYTEYLESLKSRQVRTDLEHARQVGVEQGAQEAIRPIAIKVARGGKVIENVRH